SDQLIITSNEGDNSLLDSKNIGYSIYDMEP
ncbi:hypothetical protein DERP_013265, partial [Dermatophagoides pteronyssinus]